MAITKEYLDSISFEIAKQKYYNANKVDARMDELKALVGELIDENEKLRSGAPAAAAPSVDTDAVLAKAQAQADDLTAKAQLLADSMLGSAKLESETMLAQAKEQAQQMLKNAESTAAQSLSENAKLEAEAITGSARLEAEKILAKAKEQARLIVDSARAKAAEIEASIEASSGFSAKQLEAIDKINKQLDELNVMQGTQIFRLKQALISMATDK